MSLRNVLPKRELSFPLEHFKGTKAYCVCKVDTHTKHISLWVHDYYGDRAQNRTGNKKQGLHMECLRPWGYSTRNTRGSYLHGQRKFKKMSPQGCKDIEWVSNLHSMCGHFFVSFTLHIIQHCKRHYVDMCTSTVFRVRCDYDDFFCWHFVHSVKTRHP